MRIEVRVLNKGEVFPCSIKKAKELFKNTALVLNFAKYGRVFGTFSNTPDKFYVKHNVKGTVVAASYMSCGVESSMISFYVLKATEYSNVLKEKFETEFLPEFLRLYETIRYRNEEKNITNLLLIELVNNELKTHHLTFR